jgi:hypothetical protein
VLKIDQPKVSALARERLAGVSLDRIVRFLVLLGSDVESVVKPRARASGRARVLAREFVSETCIQISDSRLAAFLRPSSATAWPAVSWDGFLITRP